MSTADTYVRARIDTVTKERAPVEHRYRLTICPTSTNTATIPVQARLLSTISATAKDQNHQTRIAH